MNGRKAQLRFTATMVGLRIWLLDAQNVIHPAPTKIWQMTRFAALQMQKRNSRQSMPRCVRPATDLFANPYYSSPGSGIIIKKHLPDQGDLQSLQYCCETIEVFASLPLAAVGAFRISGGIHLFDYCRDMLPMLVFGSPSTNSPMNQKPWRRRKEVLFQLTDLPA